MSKPRVAILGLGIMGARMAGRLLSAGFTLAVYNRNPESALPFSGAGAWAATSPDEAASRADVVIGMVADDLASRAVWLGDKGALAGASRGSTLIECSTLSVGWVRELATAAAQRGCEFLDAPVTGTKPHAASGELLFLVGGAAGVLRAVSILTEGAPGSGIVKRVASRAAANDFDPNFTLRLMTKDLMYAEKEASARGIQLKTASSALEVFQQALATGPGEEDFSAVTKAVKRD